MEELVAGPLQGSDHDRLTAFIKLERPAALGLILCCRLKEPFVEGSSRQVKLFVFLGVLNISEMEIAI